MHVIGGSNAGEALDPRDGVRERCPARERREPSDHKSRWRSSTAKRIPIAEGASLRSRVPPKWHARFWSRGGGSDPSIDCNYVEPPGRDPRVEVCNVRWGLHIELA